MDPSMETPGPAPLFLDLGRDASSGDGIQEPPSCYTSFPVSGLIYPGDQCTKPEAERDLVRPVACFAPMDGAGSYDFDPVLDDVKILCNGNTTSVSMIALDRSRGKIDRCILDTADLHVIFLLGTYHLARPSPLSFLFQNVPTGTVTEDCLLDCSADGFDEPVPTRGSPGKARLRIRVHPSGIDSPAPRIHAAKTRLDAIGIERLGDMRGCVHRPEMVDALCGIKHREGSGEIGTDPFGRGCIRITSDELCDAISCGMRSAGDNYVAMGLGTMRRHLEDEGANWKSVFNPYEPCQLPGTKVLAVTDTDLDLYAPKTIFAVDKQRGARYIQGPILAETGPDGLTRFKEYFEYVMADGMRRDGAPADAHTAIRIDAADGHSRDDP